MSKQKTIQKSVSYTGIGLHSGKAATVVLKPLPENSGIIFSRIDLENQPLIPAVAENVTSTLRATTLSKDEGEVFTIEHLLAALFIADIDNCLLEMDGPEPPVADGSAKPFIDLLLEAGIIEQEAERQIKAVSESFSVHDGDRYIIFIPYEGQRFSFLSLNEHPLLGAQYVDVEIGKTNLLNEIAPARTIAFLHEVEDLKKMGLGLGGNKENVIIYDDHNVLTPLRFADELVRHKLLDLLGDLSLAGRFKGHIIAVKSGHALNTTLAAKIRKYIHEGESI